MLLTDLTELKTILDIEPGDKSEDKKLWLYVEWASALIEEMLNRPGLTLHSRTEYYDGTGTDKLLLRARPVFVSPTPQVFLDEGGRFGQVSGAFAGQSELTYGTDFYLNIDTDDSSFSRGGILYKMSGGWPKRVVRQAGLLSPFVAANPGIIKVVYTGGYTVDSMPSAFRMAVNFLIAKMRYLFPLGAEIVSDSYEEKRILLTLDKKNYLTTLVKPFVYPYRNFRW